MDHDGLSLVSLRYVGLDPVATDRLLQPLMHLYQTARQEIDRHVQDYGRCALCRTPFPCERVALAEMALASF